jgi:hypothetical protein
VSHRSSRTKVCKQRDCGAPNRSACRFDGKYRTWVVQGYAASIHGIVLESFSARNQGRKLVMRGFARAHNLVLAGESHGERCVIRLRRLPDSC